MAKRTNYDRGRETEYRIIKELTKKGYVGAVRTAGSHGMFDVIAFGNGTTLLIQAKRSKKAISFEKAYKDDLEVILDQIHQFGADVQIEAWIWVDRHGWHQKLIIKSKGERIDQSAIPRMKRDLFGENG